MYGFDTPCFYASGVLHTVRIMFAYTSHPPRTVSNPREIFQGSLPLHVTVVLFVACLCDWWALCEHGLPRKCPRGSCIGEEVCLSVPTGKSTKEDVRVEGICILCMHTCTYQSERGQPNRIFYPLEWWSGGCLFNATPKGWYNCPNRMQQLWTNNPRYPQSMRKWPWHDSKT